MWWLWFLVGFIVGCAATYVWFIIKLLNCKIKEGTPSASHNTAKVDIFELYTQWKAHTKWPSNRYQGVRFFMQWLKDNNHL